MEAGPIEAEELERAADRRLRKLGESPSDTQSAAAARLLQKLADDLRGLSGSPLGGSPAYVEYLAILNWLGEFDVTEEFSERANEYRSRIGIAHFPENGEAYLRALITLARDTAGAEISGIAGAEARSDKREKLLHRFTLGSSPGRGQSKQRISTLVGIPDSRFRGNDSSPLSDNALARADDAARCVNCRRRGFSRPSRTYSG